LGKAWIRRQKLLEKRFSHPAPRIKTIYLNTTQRHKFLIKKTC
jgi:hypothetical protein